MTIKTFFEGLFIALVVLYLITGIWEHFIIVKIFRAIEEDIEEEEKRKEE